MIKRTLLILAAAILVVFAADAQRWLIYETFSDGSPDTSRTLVATSPNQNAALISSADPEEANPIPGIAKHFTYIDYKRDTVFYQLYYSKDEKYYTGYSLNNSNEYTLEKTEKLNGYNCKKYTTSLFSNKMEIWVTEDMKNHRGTPSASFGNLPGVVVQIVRNGNTTTRLASVEKYKDVELIIPDNLGQYTDRRAISNLEKEKLVITIPVFRDAQICSNPKLEKSKVVPFDTVLPYSNGTIILKRMNLKQLPPHYQLFAELTEQSNGDAYDRTGSIFVIPASQKVNFLNALIDSVGVLPVFTDRNGAQYQGIKLENDYTPLVELVRFFTPFGVHHFNQYRSLNDKEWEDAAYYKQDVSDLRQYLQGDVYIGAFIGNYDAGGHKVTLDLKNIYSRNPMMPPHHIGPTGEIQNSMVSDGCNIDGKLEFSIIFPGVIIGKDAVINSSILFPGVVVEDGAHVEFSIIAENTVIGKNAKVGAAPTEMENRDDWGITVVGNDLKIGEGVTVPCKAMIDKDMEV